MASIRSGEPAARWTSFPSHLLLDEAEKHADMVRPNPHRFHANPTSLGDAVSNLWSSHRLNSELDRTRKMASCRHRVCNNYIRNMDDRGSHEKEIRAEEFSFKLVLVGDLENRLKSSAPNLHR